MKLACLELGAREARPLVWLHGFPDVPVTARGFLERLDRRVIAPWLRGYAPSPLAGPYDLTTLARDVIELVRDRGPVDLVGHDWGAAVAYTVCAIAPARVRRCVTLALPHPRTFRRRLALPAQLRKSWYMMAFQAPGAGWFAPRLIDRLWRDWSPGFALPEPDRAAVQACLRASMPAPIAYYRTALRNVGIPRDRIDVPVLQLHGAQDGCVLPPGEGDAARFRERTYEVVPGVGHWLHLEAPDVIAARIRAFTA